MKHISLPHRQIAPEVEAEMSQLLLQFGTLQEDARTIAIHMLASSQSFTSFLHYVQKQGPSSCQRTRLVDVGPELAQKYTDSRSSPNKWNASEPWMSVIHRHDRNSFAKALGVAEVDFNNVRSGCHALLTPPNQQSDKGCILLGAVTRLDHGIDGNAMDKIFVNLFPRHGSYSAQRLKDDQLEQLVGMRSGFIHFFLADDALENMDGIALNSSYATPEVPDGHIIFTMHERFFFICGLQDLSTWLKTDDARKAYANKIRMIGHKYRATLDDVQVNNPLTILSIQQFVRQRGENIVHIPQANLASAYLSTVDRNAGEKTPHLTWNTPVIAEKLDIQKRILKEMEGG